MFSIPLIFAAPAVLVTLVGLGALYSHLARYAAGAAREQCFLRCACSLGSVRTRRSRRARPGRFWFADGGGGADHPGHGAAVMERPRRACRRRAAAGRDRRRLGGRADLRATALPLRGSAWTRRPGPAGSSPSSRSREGGRDIVPLDAAEIEGRLRALAPSAYEPQPGGCDRRRSSSFSPREPKSDVLWIADGVELGGAEQLCRAARLVERDAVEVVTDGTARAPSPASKTSRRLDRRASSAPTNGRRRRARRALSTPKAAKSRGRRSTSARNSSPRAVSSCRSNCATKPPRS